MINRIFNTFSLFKQESLFQDKPVSVDFWSEWERWGKAAFLSTLKRVSERKVLKRLEP